MIAQIAETMGYSIWLPKNDRGRVLYLWEPKEGALFNVLPLHFDDTTIKTIEQIDVLWLNGRAIVRAFGVEHTTSVMTYISLFNKKQ